MVTKGVASVRSAVRNLTDFNPNVNHNRFVDAVVRSFQEEYDISEEPLYVEEDSDSPEVDAIREGIDELRTWDWQYGQTPEFTYSISQKFEWGDASAELHSKHGIILSCTLDCPGIDADSLENLTRSLQGARYGLPENIGVDVGIGGDVRLQEIQHWLQDEMRT